jgi:hypothetical protein
VWAGWPSPIDLLAGGSGIEGPTPNDPGDVDAGPNDFQNFPVITNVGPRNLMTTVSGTLDSRPSTTYRVELFRVPLQNGITGQPVDTFIRYLGATDVTTDSNGSGQFTVDLPGLERGNGVTATATGPTSGTSEFAPPDLDVAPGVLVTPTLGLHTTELGGTATFTVALTTRPTSDVVLPLTSNSPTEATVSPSALTFTPDNGTVPQTVTVRGVDDTTPDGPRTAYIDLGSPQSDDPSYHGLQVTYVSVTNDDDDTPMSCAPRPPVKVTVVRSGAGALSVSVRATSADGAHTNTLTELRFRAPSDVAVDLPGQAPRSGTFIQTLSGRPSSVTFTVTRATPGPMTLPFDVVDACGPWTTFVGDGGR